MPINDLFMLPKRVRTMDQMADLLAAEQNELTHAQRTIAELERQLTINTSTFLLQRHEKIFGLSVNTAESLDVRRARLLSKLNTRDIVSRLFIKILAETFIDGTADVKENFTEYSFCVIIHVTTSPEKNLIFAFQQQIEELKPAHLIVELLIRIHRQLDHLLYTGFSVRIGRRTTVSCEIPAALDLVYVSDEDGNLLTDENGDRIIDEEG